nr:MAG TPA: hypothetical protein [Caudoviricetes sp.]
MIAVYFICLHNGDGEAILLITLNFSLTPEILSPPRSFYLIQFRRELLPLVPCGCWL